uniref:Attacin C-terminal domain-containing protein n=1 Tax=Anopheles atroparvus TaxID=41427 RepID=A0A8W7NLI1_ANOAO
MKLNLFLYGLLVICVSFICAKPLQEGQLAKKNVWERHRIKRQFSLNLGATHEDGYGTDVNAEAIASLWKSTSGNTKLDGSATYTQHFGGLAGDGKPRIAGLLTFSHNY